MLPSHKTQHYGVHSTKPTEQAFSYGPRQALPCAGAVRARQRRRCPAKPITATPGEGHHRSSGEDVGHCWETAGMWHKGNCCSPGPPDEGWINTLLWCLTRLLGGEAEINEYLSCQRVHFHPNLSQPDASSCPATPSQPNDCSLTVHLTAEYKEPVTQQSIME